MRRKAQSFGLKMKSRQVPCLLTDFFMSNSSSYDLVIFMYICQNLDAKIKKWAHGKEGNIRSLLSTLQYVSHSFSCPVRMKVFPLIVIFLHYNWWQNLYHQQQACCLYYWFSISLMKDLYGKKCRHTMYNFEAKDFSQNLFVALVVLFDKVTGWTHTF